MPRLQLLGHSPDVLYLGDDIVNRVFYGDIQIFPRGYSMGAVVGSYSFNGQPAIMSKSRILSMGVGAYTLTGQAASLSRSLKVIAALGTYALSGQNATLSKTRRLISDVGAYTLTGQDANLKYSVLVAAVGTFTLTGHPVGLVYARRMAANLGTYVLTGQDTQAYKTILMPAAVGSYSLSGQAVNLVPTRKVIAAVGNYTLTGQIANLIRSLRLVADAASYILTGQSSILAYNRVLKAGVGSYAFAGQDATLTKTSSLPVMSSFSSTTSTGATIAWPGSIAAGDVAILLDWGYTVFSTPADVAASGFTDIINGSTTTGVERGRIKAYYKILTGSESGSITGLSSTSMAKALFIFRGTIAVTTVTAFDATQEITANNPADQTVAVSGQALPMALIGFVTANNATPAFDAGTTTFDGTVSTTRMFAGYKLFNVGDTPVDHAVVTSDAGFNGLITFGVSFA